MGSGDGSKGFSRLSLPWGGRIPRFFLVLSRFFSFPRPFSWLEFWGFPALFPHPSGVAWGCPQGGLGSQSPFVGSLQGGWILTEEFHGIPCEKLGAYPGKLPGMGPAGGNCGIQGRLPRFLLGNGHFFRMILWECPWGEREFTPRFLLGNDPSWGIFQGVPVEMSMSILGVPSHISPEERPFL